MPSAVAVTATARLRQTSGPAPQSAPQSGGDGVSKPPTRLNKPAAEWTANEILHQLLATYRAAKTCQDQAVVRLSFRQGGQLQAQSSRRQWRLSGPARCRLRAYQATIKCDGRELRAGSTILASIWTGRSSVRPVRGELKLTDLAADELLYNILISRLQRQPIQLELLLESSGLVSAFGSDVACERLADETEGGQACFRVAVPSPGGAFVFWVDQDDFLLRRLDYPAAAVIGRSGLRSDGQRHRGRANLRGAEDERADFQQLSSCSNCQPTQDQ